MQRALARNFPVQLCIAVFLGLRVLAVSRRILFLFDPYRNRAGRFSRNAATASLCSAVAQQARKYSLSRDCAKFMSCSQAFFDKRSFVMRSIGSGLAAIARAYSNALGNKPSAGVT